MTTFTSYYGSGHLAFFHLLSLVGMRTGSASFPLPRPFPIPLRGIMGFLTGPSPCFIALAARASALRIRSVLCDPIAKLPW